MQLYVDLLFDPVASVDLGATACIHVSQPLVDVVQV